MIAADFDEAPVLVELLPAQYDAMTAEEPYVCYCGGIGSGKTFLGAQWLVSSAVEFPKGCHVATANTYPQLDDVVRPNIEETLEARGIEYEWNASKKVFNLADGAARIMLRSLEKPNRLRGLEIDRWWGDEARDYSADAWNVLFGRMRGRRADRPRSMLTTTPNGFGEIYKRFVEVADPLYRVVRARTRDNPYLPDGYEDEVRRAYRGTPELAQQELDGEFVAVGALRACPTFNRTKHVRPLTLSPTAPTFVCFDWNVGKISALIVQEAGGEIRFVREVRAQFAEAAAAGVIAAVTVRDAVGREVRPLSVELHGDAGQGAERSVQTGRTVWEDMLLRLAPLRPTRGWPSANPRIVDRVTSTAHAFESLPVFVDPSCVEFIADLERTQWDGDGRKLDDKDPLRGHFFDAGGYYLHARHRPSAFKRPEKPVGLFGEPMRSAAS